MRSVNRGGRGCSGGGGQSRAAHLSSCDRGGSHWSSCSGAVFSSSAHCSNSSWERGGSHWSLLLGAWGAALTLVLAVALSPVPGSLIVAV